MGKRCMLCPRRCGAQRDEGERGYCRMGAEIRVARAALHPFEEPPISGTRGSGTVFFAGCSLGCLYCQNKAIQSPDAGAVLSEAELAALFLFLQEKGAHNINLVTPTHFADRAAAALELAKPRLRIPVVYNCGGYESVATLSRLAGLVDIYMPDFKYASPALAKVCSNAPDYPERATEALAEMFRQVGAAAFDAAGLMTRGVLVRHLVLPGHRADSMAVLERVTATVPPEQIRLSLMRQYTPEFAPADAPKELTRRVTTFEYERVLAHAEKLGFIGFSQDKTSATAAFTPDFAEQDLLDEFRRA